MSKEVGLAMGFSSTSTASVLGKKFEYLFGKSLLFYVEIYPRSDLHKRRQPRVGVARSVPILQPTAMV